MTEKILLTPRQSRTHFVQTQRETHEAWSKLIRKSAIAGSIMHELAARVGDHNAVVISNGALAKLVGCHRNSVIKAIKLLEEGRWLQIGRIGERGTTNAYILNDTVAWTKSRDNLKFSLFSATVIIDALEQVQGGIDRHGPLRRLPRIGEEQMPTGEGLPPPSEPALPGMDTALPATGSYDPETGEIYETNDLIQRLTTSLRVSDNQI